MGFFEKIVSWLMAVLFMLLSWIGYLQLPGEADLRVVSYVVADSAQQVAALDDSHMGDLTDIILIGSLASFDTQGNVNLCGDFPEIIRGVKDLTRAHPVKLHLNIAGPGYVEGDSWEEKMESQIRRHEQAFASGVLEDNVRALLDRYGLDGICFDYEYPVSQRSRDAFGAFLVSLRGVLQGEYEIGCAMSAWCASLPPEAVAVIDRVEVMSYDVWDRTGRHATYDNARDAVNAMLELGYAPSQLDLGLPFYGRPTTHDEVWYAYKDHCDQMDFAGLMRDDRGLTASFNTPDVVYAKTRFAVRKNLGGVFAWHYDLDVPKGNRMSLFDQVVRAKGKPCREKAPDYEPTPGAELAASPFSCAAVPGGEELAADTALAFNAVYKLFGGSDADASLVFRFGNEPAYFDWMATKLAWTDDEAYKEELIKKIADFPQTDNGYLWSWSTSTWWPTGKGELHYDGLFRYVAAVAELLRWSGDTALLQRMDETTQGEDTRLDASAGRTVYEKCVKAMEYAETALDGASGVITLTEKSAFLADGVTRFDLNAQGEPVWNNTGRAGSASSNYWDNLCFGHKDAYETALYYHALRAMRDIETVRGDTQAASRYETLSVTVRTAFDDAFWSRETGRYVACIDADGRAWDPGLTFLNVEALAYGLGDAEKAEQILSWLDGTRRVPGDTVTGEQVLSYSAVLDRAAGRKIAPYDLYLAPITNTVSIERLSGDGAPWWYDLEGQINVGEGQNAAYRRHLENGGYIFYPVYYELRARAMYRGASDASRRAAQIAEVYRFNGLDSDFGGWVEGLVGEFPENGIVSRAFVSSLAGVDAAADALVVSPRLPDGFRSLGVRGVRYRGVTMDVEARADGLSLESTETLAGVLRFSPQSGTRFVLTATRPDGTRADPVVLDAQSGSVTIDLTELGASALTIRPQ